MKKPKPRLYKGFRDLFAGDLAPREWMLAQIRSVYERYGYTRLETPAVEHVDVLGKFLPESDQPDGGIFSWKNEDDDWVALRYDLTAPLSRVVAQYQELPKPFRRYQFGPVYRMEKPGPGRFREFIQCDIDTVGTASMAADAELCGIMCETLEALGIQRGEYVIRVNDRKILNGVLQVAGLDQFEKAVSVTIPSGINKGNVVRKVVTTSDIFRAIDKLDKVGLDGVRRLLGDGRMDGSGDFTAGCQLESSAIELVVSYLNASSDSRAATIEKLAAIVGDSPAGVEGISELRQIDEQLTALGYGDDCVVIDPTVVRGLDYYTGPVIEGALTFEIKDDDGNVKTFGSIAGGGRYDGLVSRFTGQAVPATGCSIGVDRLLAALQLLKRVPNIAVGPQALVTVFDKSRMSDYQILAAELRRAGISTELFLGSGNIGKQFRYADQRQIAVAVICGEDEFNAGTVQLKDLRMGRELATEIMDREEWRRSNPAQISVSRDALVDGVKGMLERY